jgi:hypothetical protein
VVEVQTTQKSVKRAICKKLTQKKSYDGMSLYLHAIYVFYVWTVMDMYVWTLNLFYVLCSMYVSVLMFYVCVSLSTSVLF